MDKVQIIDRSNTTPLSKTFKDEEGKGVGLLRHNTKMHYTIIIQKENISL
jgi:hypothetical protein